LESPELIKRLGRESKVQVLVSEACAGEFSTSEVAELLELLAAGPAEKGALSVAVLDALAAAGTRAGRIEDLRKAFGAPHGTGRTVSQPTGAEPTRKVAQDAPIRGTASQQTRPVQSPFRARFDASRPAAAAPPFPSLEQLPPSAGGSRPATSVGGPPLPRTPLPLRGKAAEILKGGTTPGQTGPATAPGAAADTFFGGGKGKPSAESVLGPAANRPVILLADDDKRIRMVYRLKLEEKGFSVQEAADGLEAWKRLELGGISAAVLDMKMPGLHGLEILSRLADSGQELPVVICTAYDRLDDEFVVATYPKLRYLTKPVDGEQLAETLNSLLAE
jgi:CheY-like chemotaxis protein